MTIKQILDFVNYIANKEQMGQSLSPENYNALLSGFNTKALYGASSLRPFRTFTTLTTDANGIAVLPTDYVHYNKLLASYGATLRTIDVLSEEEMANRRTSLMETSLLIKPACTLYGSDVQFFPKNIGHYPNPAIELKYVRMPVAPNYDWCISNATGLHVFMPVGSYITDNGGTTAQTLYDASANILAADVEIPHIVNTLPYTSATVELEWEKRFHWTFVSLLLTAMGINLKDEQVRSYKEGN
jgi:hypothetical protein